MGWFSLLESRGSFLFRACRLTLQTYAGLTADSRPIINRARAEARNYKVRSSDTCAVPPPPLFLSVTVLLRRAHSRAHSERPPVAVRPVIYVVRLDAAFWRRHHHRCDRQRMPLFPLFASLLFLPLRSSLASYSVCRQVRNCT